MRDDREAVRDGERQSEAVRALRGGGVRVCLLSEEIGDEPFRENLGDEQILHTFTASQEKSREERAEKRERALSLVLSCSRASACSLPRVARSIDRSYDLEELKERVERAGSAKKWRRSSRGTRRSENLGMSSSSSKDGSSDFAAQFDCDGAENKGIVIVSLGYLLKAMQMTESMSQEWTDEKHSLYLNSMEASFVRQLNSHEYHSVSLFCQHSNLTPLMDMPDSSSLYSNANNSISSGQFKVLQGGSWRGITFERAQLKHQKIDDSHLLLENQWIRHFRSAGKQEVILSDRHENSFTSKEPVGSKEQKKVFHRAGTCSKEVHASMYHQHSVDGIKDQCYRRREAHLRRGCLESPRREAQGEPALMLSVDVGHRQDSAAFY
ncbi:hypothetical protein Syun_004219 [Stephania yunnanensis]|uniref:Uncharacterized protein n=1 Tax=Stephania yunnanensis TaxID=152371 RepID=A0AAP0L2M1_9MAGN